MGKLSGNGHKHEHLTEGQVDAGHDTRPGLRCLSHSPLAPGCSCPSERLEKGNTLINKDSECGRGDGTGAQEKPRSHLPSVWDQYPFVWGDLHKVLSAHLGGETPEAQEDGRWWMEPRRGGQWAVLPAGKGVTTQHGESPSCAGPCARATRGWE